MTPLPLHLHPSGRELHPACAWLLSGHEAVRWVEEILSWRLPEASLALYLLPGGQGVLVAAEGGPPAPARAPMGLAFGRLGERAFLPVEAELQPALDREELEALLPPGTALFHPGLGLLYFLPGTALRLGDLLRPRRETPCAWQAPWPEAMPAEALAAIAFRAGREPADLFGGAGAGIGEGSPEELPPAEGEPRGPLAEGWRQLRGLFRGAGAGGSGARESIEHWARTHLPGAARELGRRRAWAVQRLLEQLARDPDEALKRALPLQGSGAPRGQAPPGENLAAHGTDFSLSRLGGGKPVDPWVLPEEIAAELRRRYHELAERERHLGRHRRAAYIYAELLGNLNAAVHALEEGGHWREAGLLYRDHLHQPVEAARCLVKARLFAEAVELYQQAGEWELLATLYETLGRPELAAQTWRRWVEALLAEGRQRRAAEVLEEKLQARAEALEVLEQAWPHHAEAQRCLECWFAWRALAGEHAEALALLQRLEGQLDAPRRALELMELVGSVQGAYPDRLVRRKAEDLGRQVVAALARRQEWPLLESALRRVGGLAPDDRLLARDAQRFLEALVSRRRQAEEVAPSRRVTPQSRRATSLVLQREFAVKPGVAEWQLAVATPSGFALAGSRRRKVAVARCSFEGAQQTVRWENLREPQLTAALFCAQPSSAEQIFLAGWGQPLPFRIFAPGVGLPNPARTGTPPWVGRELEAAACTVEGTLWVATASQGHRTLSAYRPEGTLLMACPAPRREELFAEPAFGPILAAAGREVILAEGTVLARCTTAEGAGLPQVATLCVFEERIRGLVPGPPLGAPHVVVVLETGLAVCWLGFHHGRVQVLEAAGPDARVGMSSDGTVVAIAGEEGWLIDFDSRGRLRMATFAWEFPPPVAVLRGPSALTFTAVEAGGQVRIFGFSGAIFRHG